MVTLSKALTIKFNEVPIAGLDYKFTDQTGELNSVLFDLLGDFPVYKTSLRLTCVEGMVQLKGQIAGELHHLCSRCAEEFRRNYSKAFTTMYYQSEDKLKTFGEGIEDLEGSFDLEFLEGNEINLGDTIHEQIALEMPFQPLCSEICKGLCSQCGTNLNSSACACTTTQETRQPARHSPFEKLKSLRGE